MRSIIRKPSVKKSVSARTIGRATRTMRKVSSPAYGMKGVGYVKNSKKALYNNLYNKTSYGVRDIIKTSGPNNSVTSNTSQYQRSSVTYLITNNNITEPVQQYPQVIIIRKQCVKKILFGILLLFIACLCIVSANSPMLFTVGLILIGVSIYQFYKGNQYRNSYKKAKESLHRFRSSDTEEYLRKLRS